MMLLSLILQTYIRHKWVCGTETFSALPIHDFILLRYIAECGLSGCNGQAHSLTFERSSLVLMRNVYIYSVSLDLEGVCTCRLGGQSSSSSRRWRSRSTATRFPSATSRAAWPSTPAARRRASASPATTSAWPACSCRCWGQGSGRCHRGCCQRPSWSHMWVADGIQGHIQDFHLGGCTKDGVQGPHKVPGNSRVLDALSCYLSLILKQSDFFFFFFLGGAGACCTPTWIHQSTGIWTCM